MKASVLPLIAALGIIAQTFAADPVQEWVKRYHGPKTDTAQTATYLYNAPMVITADARDNVYVSGVNDGRTNAVFSDALIYPWGGMAYDDMVTIMYDAAGQQKWLKVYNGPGDSLDVPVGIEAGSSGAVYVAGSSFGGATLKYDMVVIKYTSAGDTAWVRRYTNGDTLNQKALAMTVDKDENVYVTGAWEYRRARQKMLTLKYDKDGVLKWAAADSAGYMNLYTAGNAIAVDTVGNVYIAGETRIAATNGDNDILAVKYNAAGARQWLKTLGGKGNYYDKGAAIAVDGNGNIFVGGIAADSNTSESQRFMTIKYNAQGDTLWARKHQTTADHYNLLKHLALDPSGNVIVSGVETNSATGTHKMAMAKYHPAGELAFSRTLESHFNGAIGMAIGLDGSIYLAGNNNLDGQDREFMTVKYDTGGTVVWSGGYNFADHGDNDAALCLAMAPSGNALYCAGWSTATLHNHPAYEFATIKYSLNLTKITHERMAPKQTTASVIRNSGPRTMVLSLPSLKTGYTVKIYNASGACAFAGSSGGVRELHIDTRKFAVGVYCCEICGIDGYHARERISIVR